jgi:hypothetical protein
MSFSGCTKRIAVTRPPHKNIPAPTIETEESPEEIIETTEEWTVQIISPRPWGQLTSYQREFLPTLLTGRRIKYVPNIHNVGIFDVFERHCPVITTSRFIDEFGAIMEEYGFTLKEDDFIVDQHGKRAKECIIFNIIFNDPRFFKELKTFLIHELTSVKIAQLLLISVLMPKGDELYDEVMDEIKKIQRWNGWNILNQIALPRQ